MKRVLALLIVILALIAAAGRADFNDTSDLVPVSAEITEKPVSPAETPEAAAVSPMLPPEDNEPQTPIHAN